MTVQIHSTTDTPEQVLAAAGKAPTPAELKPSVPAGESAPVEKTAPSEEGETPLESEPKKEDATPTGDNLEQPAKKKGGFQKKIDKLTTRVSDAEERAQYWRREAERRVSPAPPVNQQAPQKEVPAGKPAAETFDTHAEYVEALTTWTVKQNLKEAEDVKKAEADQKVRQTKATEWTKRVAVAREVHDDFDDVMQATVPVSPAMREVIVDSEHGAEMAYFLGKNPDEAHRIAQLSPIAAAREMGRIEAKFGQATSGAPAGKPVAPKPKPIAPISGNGATPSGKTLDEMDYQDFKKARRKSSS